MSSNKKDPTVKPNDTHVTDEPANSDIKPLDTHVTDVTDGKDTPDDTHVTSEPS